MKCISCGAELSFDAKSQKLVCKYCKNSYDPETYDVENKKAIENKVESNVYICTQCGAKLLTFDDTAATFCSYCHSAMVLDDRIKQDNIPKLIVPFKITKEECIKIYKNKIKKYFFAPKYMKNNIGINQFRGIYMPFAIYKAEHHGIQENKGEKYWKRRGDYVYYKDYQIKSDVDFSLDGIAFDVASNFSDKYSQSIVPFNLKEACPFDTKYMSGFYADAKDVDDKTYSSQAENIAHPIAINKMRKVKEMYKYGCHNPDLSLNITDIEIAYLPVYFLSIKNKKNNTMNYAVINGQTGKMALELPIDFKKYIIFSSILSILIFFIINTKLFLLPKQVVIFSMIISIITLIFSLIETAELIEHENFSNDLGYIQKNKIKEVKTKSKIFKQIIPIIVCILTLILKPVNDIYYYIVSIISLLLVLWSFYDLTKKFNLLTSRKLSQLYKRGGDENE